jgi:glycerol uptake facilitator-like aquaporin
MNASLFRKWIVEFIGTFFLVYVVGCVSLQEHVLLGPLAIGGSLMVMIFSLLGLANPGNLWMYWLSEFLGAGVAAVFFLVVNQEKPPELSVASHDRAPDQTNQSIRAV